MKERQLIFPTLARTATSTVTLACESLGGLFVINVTAVTATPSVVFTISGVEPASGSTAAWTILASAAITGTGITVLRVHPSLTASANAIAKDILPSSISVVATHADTDSITYSVEFIGVN